MSMVMPNQGLKRALHARCGASRVGGVSVLLFALLGLLGGPCGMVFADLSKPDVPVVTPGDASVGLHDQCPNAGDNRAMDSADCCCVLLVAAGTAESQPQPSVVFWALLPAPTIDMPLPAMQQFAGRAPPRACLHQTSPPVYLATRRLRI